MAHSTTSELILRSARRFPAAIGALALLMVGAAPVHAQGLPPLSPSQGQPAPAAPAPVASPPSMLQGQPPVVPPGQPPAPQMGAEPPAAEAPRKPDNMFEAIGRWWDKSATEFKQSVEENNAKWRQSVDEQNAKLKQSLDEQNAKWRELNARNEKAAKEAAAASRDAAEAFKSLSNVRLVEGRQVCEIAANGSPDCQTAAEVFCRSKGFAGGKSADITTTRKCKMRSLIRHEERECKVETVVIKAACQ